MPNHSMKTTKVVNLLESFSPTDWSRMEKFVLSPYHNQHAEATRMFQYYKHIDWKNEYMLTRGAVFQFIAPDQPFDDQRLRHITSYLMRVAEAFLVAEEMKGKPMEHNLQLQAAYQRRKLENLYLSNYKTLLKKQEFRPLRDREYYEVDVRMFLNHYNSTMDRSGQGYHTLALLSQSMDRLFIIQKLQQAGRLLAHKQLHEKELPIGMLEEVLRYVAENDLESVPAISLHLNAYRMLADRNAEPAFRKLKQQLQEYTDLFQKEEIRALMIIALNYGIIQINKGRKEYIREVFELYRDSLSTKILFDNNQLSPFAYKNIVASALKLGEFNWTEDFIENYKSDLPELQRDNFYAYNRAKLLFARGDFSDAANILQKLYIKDFFTNLDARVTLLKAYFEMGEYQQIEYQLNNLQQLLRRKEVQTYHRTNYSNFSKFLNRMMNLQPLDKEAKSKLIEEVNAAEILTDRPWILLKLGVEGAS